MNIRDPHETYSVEEFSRDCWREMRRIARLEAIPLLVGGTMFYFQALFRGLSALPAADPALRESLAGEAEQIGWPEMHRRLADIDPAAAKRISPNDRQRIQRALEISRLSGRPPADLYRRRRRRSEIDGRRVRFIRLVIADSRRDCLHRRIEARFDAMLKDDFESEVRGLMALPRFDPDLPAMRMVGYRQMIAFCGGKTSYDTMRHAAIAATRQLAKRQLTWLRNNGGNVWFDARNTGLKQTIDRYLSSRLSDLRYNPQLL